MRPSRRRLIVIPESRTASAVGSGEDEAAGDAVTLGHLVDDVEGEVVEERPVKRGRSLDPFEPAVFQPGDVVSEVLRVAGRRERHVATRADALERGPRHLAVGVLHKHTEMYTPSTTTGGLCRRRRGRRRSEASDAEHRQPRATALRARVHPNRLTEVIALEPEPTLRAAAERAADDAPVPVRVM